MSNVDISVAVATKSGLITPIVKNTPYLSVDEISDTVKVLHSYCSELFLFLIFSENSHSSACWKHLAMWQPISTYFHSSSSRECFFNIIVKHPHVNNINKEYMYFC